MLAKAAVTTLVLVLVSSEAWAIQRYTSTSMTCAKIQATLKREGAAILRTTGRTGQPIYGRFVRNVNYCTNGETTVTRRIPASDTRSCPVSMCTGMVPAGRD